MKRIKLILVCGAVLALTGLTTLLVAAGAQRDATAIVRSVFGDVTYQPAGSGTFMPLRANAELGQKTVIKAGAGASAYLQVNGYVSMVKVTESTTMTLKTMTTTGPGYAADTSTDLKLDGGTIMGNVRKLSANSDYKVTVPNGMAGIRGTDFQVTVFVQPNGAGAITVTFTSVTGLLFCQVNPPAGTTPEQASKMLDTGESWTVTGNMDGTTLSLGTVGLLTPIELAALRDYFRKFPPFPFPFRPLPPHLPPWIPPNPTPSDIGGGHGPHF